VAIPGAGRGENKVNVLNLRNPRSLGTVRLSVPKPSRCFLKFRIALVLLLTCALIACDETSEVACENASCPPGTTIDLEAASTNSCEGSASGTYEANLLGAEAEAEISGQCFSEGSCVYACYTTTKCCGAETWTQTSYTCDQPCEEAACGNDECESGEDTDNCPEDCTAVCGNGTCESSEDPDLCPGDCLQTACGNGECEAGEDPTSCPQDCAAVCGNDECEYGETCLELACQDLTDCTLCTQDCCPACGNGVCEYPEGGEEEGSEPCVEDCGGAACVPSCTPPNCGDDGCGGSCETLCPGGFYCGDDGTCKKQEGGDNGDGCAGGCPNGEVCVNGQCKPTCPGGCPNGLICVNNECVSESACTPDCPTLPNCTDDDGCGGSCDCPEGVVCGDNNKCQADTSCTPSCPELPACTNDDGCGGTCPCPGGNTCNGTECVQASPCEPTCNENHCSGEDGCGGTCDFTCPTGESCTDSECQPDQAGETACVNSSTCPSGERCFQTTCQPCPPECADSFCPENDCGGCGKCPGSKVCTDNGDCVDAP
jgi:hypothetical protein